MEKESEFTEKEKKILEPFVSNIDKDVFVLMNLPEVIKGALFSRYSRSAKSVRRLLLDEFINVKEMGLEEMGSTSSGEQLRAAIKKAQDFYDRILDGYGDDSVGELGGAHLATENVSNVAAKFLEDSRIGGSPLEKSTRYVWFNNKVNGRYLYYLEPKIMKSRHALLYVKTNDLLFDTYSGMIDPMIAFVQDNFPLDDFEFFDISAKKEIMFSSITDEKLKKRATIAYNSAAKAKACDVLRGLLPASTLTNVGIFGNGRFFQSLLTKMYTSELSEINNLAASIHNELNTLIPSFVRRAKKDEYVDSTSKKTAQIAKHFEIEATQADIEVELLEHDTDISTMIAAILYPHSTLSLDELRKKAKKMSHSEIENTIEAYMGGRKQRRDKPGRATESIFYTFDLLTDFGIYRDLQRHRMMTQERQLLTIKHGYVMPEEIVRAGFENDFRNAMAEAASAFWEIHKDMPNEAQYVVPMASRIRWYAKLNLRAAMHLIEIRSTPQGHPAYRKVAQLMYLKIKEAHPMLAKHMKFVDMNDYPLGRMGSELKKEEKREKYN